MTATALEILQYPIGRFAKPTIISVEEIEGAIKEIELLPQQLQVALDGMSPAQLDSAYRLNGWTIRQVVHHIPDSHLNAYVRFKLALTENNPTIKPYAEDKWAELPDSTLTPIGTSIELLAALHQRWVVLLKSMSEDDFNRTFFHPERKISLSLAEVVLLYAWHGKHHLGHVLLVKNR
ncbi:metal-dependent hydrolase [Solitalea longa]|uniref:Metal-dependent hydrolase n=1 Tax=Solitalea longa TaxID=2079460 RepID=A0A2S5A9G4_9SPHI|nr:putative metal-dependent hydrolase [Solitalea longa]POY38939.1 metal-dependent hydrolase [Solitalea longa]